MRTQREVSLPLAVDRDAPASLPDQLVAQLRGLLAHGVLTPGDALPSSRALASHLAVSRGTVVTAYDQLIAEGWFDGAPGRSTCVNPRLHDVHPEQSPPDSPARGQAGTPPGPSLPGQTLLAREPQPRPGHDSGKLQLAGSTSFARANSSTEAAPAAARSHPSADRVLIDLRPGRPLTDAVPGPEWRSAWRRAADAPVDTPLDPLGLPEFRSAIAEHLRRMRAVVREPSTIAITAGGREGLNLLLQATRAQSVGVEDPGYPSLRRVLTGAGVAVCPLPSDAHGLITDRLPDAAPDLVIVTPSHQYPLGGSLPIDRRQQLLTWAARHGVTIVEDDYDSELRYTSAPLPALTSLDADGRVALLGTFAKTLTPSLAMGYLVLPNRLVDAVRAVRLRLGQPVGLVPQRALASYLASGALVRHTQRMRNAYRRRRTLVVRALQDLPGVRVYPMDGGLHCVVEHDRTEASVIEALAERGVIVSALSDYWASGGSRRGLVFGFGAASDADLAAGLRLIAEVLGRTHESPRARR